MKTKHRVMVVEDDAAVLEAIQLMLGDRYSIITATNGKEAVRLYKAFKPDVVLMDIAMPVMDGVEATKEILKFDPEAKIVGITAYAKKRGRELLESGALEIIEKPFTRKKILETIEKYIEE
ncbi:response regulator [Archaeoglobus neptunius]|uniref:response regulator n=1 Tax=Archaeoglobus neptunius TaxID=2798580 RepID=UPI001928CE90|nr:response regulator [Archaeoglobus neptunius]